MLLKGRLLGVIVMKVLIILLDSRKVDSYNNQL